MDKHTRERAPWLREPVGACERIIAEGATQAEVLTYVLGLAEGAIVKVAVVLEVYGCSLHEAIDLLEAARRHQETG